jgi:hypothetical protein
MFSTARCSKHNLEKLSFTPTWRTGISRICVPWSFTFLESRWKDNKILKFPTLVRFNILRELHFYLTVVSKHFNICRIWGGFNYICIMNSSSIDTSSRTFFTDRFSANKISHASLEWVISRGNPKAKYRSYVVASYRLTLYKTFATKSQYFFRSIRISQWLNWSRRRGVWTQNTDRLHINRSGNDSSELYIRVSSEMGRNST